MEDYEAETRKILREFFAGRISRKACLVALDVEFAAVLGKPTDLPVEALWAIHLGSKELVIEEGKKRRRGRRPEKDPGDGER